MPGGLPDPSGGTLVFSTTLTAGTPLQVGTTPYGTRKIIPTSGGTLSGGTLSGTIASGAIDFDLFLPSGAVEHESRYTIKSGTSTIYMRNCGVADGQNVRFVAEFEAATSGSYSSLNSGTYVGTRKVTSGGIVLSVYKLSQATPNPNHTIVKTPADASLKQQAWNCTGPGASAAQGNSVTTAKVNIGSSLSVGTSKYGRRTIIPITGGTVSGTSLSGSVNAGGADYQLSADAGYQIEARYTIKAANGEIIVVRNCGDFGTSDLTNILFEAKTDGAYNWLNTGSFVGTLTTGIGRVTIGVYERQ